MKKVSLALILLIAVTAFSFVSSQRINSEIKPSTQTETQAFLKGADKSGYTETNENSW